METGRLIDAETLKASVRAKFPNVADRCEINELINAAPTVDAIPVEWLKEQADYRRSEWDYDTCEGIRIVLKAWEEEQEAKSDA